MQDQDRDGDSLLINSDDPRSYPTEVYSLFQGLKMSFENNENKTLIEKIGIMTQTTVSYF